MALGNMSSCTCEGEAFKSLYLSRQKARAHEMTLRAKTQELVVERSVMLSRKETASREQCDDITRGYVQPYINRH